MVTIDIKIKAPKDQNSMCRIYYQIAHNNEVRRIYSKYLLLRTEWSPTRSKVVIDNELSPRATLLKIANHRIRFEYKRLQQIAQALDRTGCNFCVDDIVATYEHHHKSDSLFGFLIDTSEQLYELGCSRTAETYSSLLSSIMLFRKGVDILLSALDANTVTEYEIYLRQRNSALNTISFYIRTLKATYNRAIERGIIRGQDIFKKAHTSIEKTSKRAIPINHISKIKHLDLSNDPQIEFARDLFLFSFYTRGMSFVDIAYLRKKDIRGGEIVYRRHKTRQRLNIKWERCMQDIVDKYPNLEMEYLLPIITDPHKESRRQYTDCLGKVNRNLKKVAALAGISTNLTSYVARHSWASAARTKRVPISVISEAMGHDNEVTTQIYLSSLDSGVIDNANRLIISSIR